MDKERLHKILSFNTRNDSKIRNACIGFYGSLNRQQAYVIPDIQALAKIVFEKSGFKFLHIPLNSKEIGAYQLRLNERNYLVLNTSKSLANNNFSLAHELYHLLIQENTGEDKAEVYLNHYEDDENEMMANAFAGNILMPAADFVATASYLPKTFSKAVGPKGEIIYAHSIVITLMDYYKTTYMSVVIRCFELNIFDIEDDFLVEDLLEFNSEDEQKNLFNKISKHFGKESIMEATYADDFKLLYDEAEEKANELEKKGLITAEDRELRLKGMRETYERIKGK